MSTVLTEPATRVATPYRLGFTRQLHSEWIKITTLRSTWWSVAITGVLTVGIAVLIALIVDGPGADGIQAVVSPIQFTMLLAGILGAIAVTGEYSTGMIRSTLTASPRRGAALLAKAIVVGAFMFLVALVTFVAAALVVTPVLASSGVVLAWDDPARSIMPILTASLAMAVFALIGVSFGFTLRSGAGAIAGTVGLLFVLPIIGSFFTSAGAWAWIADLSQYLPMSAAQAAILPQADWGLSGPVALATLGGWVLAGLLASWATLRARDA